MTPTESGKRTPDTLVKRDQALSSLCLNDDDDDDDKNRHGGKQDILYFCLWNLGVFKLIFWVLWLFVEKSANHAIDGLMGVNSQRQLTQVKELRS